MKKIFMIVGLMMMILTYYQLGMCQDLNQTVVAGFNSANNVEKLVFFNSDSLNVIKRLEFSNLKVTELKVFKNNNVERVFVGSESAPGLTVIDLKTGQIVGKLLREILDLPINMIETDGKKIYVVSGTFALFVIDPETLQVKKFARLATGILQTGDVVAMKDGVLILRLLFTNKKKNILQIYTIDSNGVEKNMGEWMGVNFGTDFENMRTAISVNEKKVYIPSKNRVTEINLVNGKRVSFRTDIEFAKKCYFDDATKTICIISKDGKINLIDRKTKSFRELRLSNEVLRVGTVTGDRNGHLFINLYQTKTDMAVLVKLDLRTDKILTNEYEKFGNSSGVDILK